MTTITIPRSALHDIRTGPLQASAGALGFLGKQWPMMITIETPGAAAQNFVFLTEAHLPGEGMLGQHFHNKAGQLLFVWNH